VHQIDQTVLEILSRATIDGATLRLPAEQLDRKTYQAVNTVIEVAGGKVAAYEVDADRLHRCKDRCLLVGGIHLTDFLLAKPAPVFDRVVMNPPFAKQLDVAHVMRAFDFLRMGGRLVSVMSTSFQFRQTKSAEQFRDFLASVNAEVEPLPNGAFKDSGTMVNSVIVSFDDPR
jgi:hypothetical protein